MALKAIEPAGWPRPRGYANGMLAPDGTLHVAGQIGWLPDGRFVARDFLGQAEQALRNVLAVVEAAGGQAGDIARLTWYVTDKRSYLDAQGEMGARYRRVMGRHFPAMAMLVVQGLVEDAALVEIEAVAHVGG